MITDITSVDINSADKKKKKRKFRLGKFFKNLGKNAASYTVLAPLRPLRGMMMKALKKEGVYVDKRTSLIDVTNRFYNNIVIKKSKNKLDEIDVYNYEQENIEPALTAIVTGIISFVKSIKDKKKRGEKLNKSEELIAKGTEEAEKKIVEQAKTETATAVGQSLLFNPKTQIIIVIIVVVGIYIFTRMRKS